MEASLDPWGPSLANVEDSRSRCPVPFKFLDGGSGILALVGPRAPLSKKGRRLERLAKDDVDAGRFRHLLELRGP